MCLNTCDRGRTRLELETGRYKSQKTSRPVEDPTGDSLHPPKLKSEFPTSPVSPFQAPLAPSRPTLCLSSSRIALSLSILWLSISPIKTHTIQTKYPLDNTKAVVCRLSFKNYSFAVLIPLNFAVLIYLNISYRFSPLNFYYD